MTPLSASGAATSHRRLRRVLISTTYAKSRPRSPTPLPSLNSKQRSSRMPGNADPDVETGSARAEEELREQRIHDGRSPGLDKMAAEAAAGWQAAYAELKRQDERMFHEYKEDIDTVLIFAGLFSAVVSSLLSQSYPLLQQDNTQVSAETLVTISQQLAALLSNATSGQEAPSPLPPAAFVPVSYAIRVNVLWFLSLVFSLAAALFGIVIKGWMQEYMAWVEWSPLQDAVGLRQYRFENWNWWQVPEIKSSLPILLQVSLFLFLVGLADMLTQASPPVAHIVASAVWVVISLAALTVVLGVFSLTCPYRSRVVWLLSMARSALRTHIGLLNALICPNWLRFTGYLFRPIGPIGLWAYESWNCLDQRLTTSARMRGIIHIFHTSRDDGLLLRLRYTLYDSGKVNFEHSLSCLEAITGNLREVPEQFPELGLHNYMGILRRVVYLQRHKTVLSTRSTELVTALVRDALWELLSTNWSASSYYKYLVGLFDRFNRRNLSGHPLHEASEASGSNSSVSERGHSNASYLEWTMSTRRDALLHEAIAYSHRLWSWAPQALDVNWTRSTPKVPADGWPHSEMLGLLDLATRCSRESRAFDPACRIAVMAFGCTRSACDNPAIQAALQQFMQRSPRASTFKSLYYVDESRLVLARFLLAMLSEARSELWDAETWRTAITSLHYLNRGAASEIHVAWRLQYLMLLDTLPPGIHNAEIESIQHIDMSDLPDVCQWSVPGLRLLEGSQRQDVLELLRCVTGTFHTAESSQESCTKLVVKASIFVMRAAAVWVSVDEQDIVVRAALRSLLHSLEDAMAYNDDLADQLSNAGVLHDLHAAGLLVFDIRPKEVVKDLDAEVYLHPAVYLVEEALRRG